MVNEKESTENIPLSVVGENNLEPLEKVSDKESNKDITSSITDENSLESFSKVNTKESPTPSSEGTGEKIAIDIAGNLKMEELHVEKIVTHHEAYNIALPDYLLDPIQESNNVAPSEKKETPTDAPDGFNDYRNKKTLTQGMMDVALFSANISQLRSILDQMASNRSNSFYCGVLIFMLVVSIFLQVGVGLLLLLSTRYNVNNAEERRMAYRYGNYVVAGIFLVTVVNVFISAFGTPGDRYVPEENYPKRSFANMTRLYP